LQLETAADPVSFAQINNSSAKPPAAGLSTFLAAHCIVKLCRKSYWKNLRKSMLSGWGSWVF